MRGHIVDSIFGKELYGEDGTHLGTILEGAIDGLSHVYDSSGSHIGTVMDGGLSDVVYYSDDGETTFHGFENPLGGMDLYSQGSFTGFTTEDALSCFELDGLDGGDDGILF